MVFASLGLVVREAFLDAGTCTRIIDAIVADGGEPAEVSAPGGTQSLDSSIRHTREVALDDGDHDRIAAAVNTLLPDLSAWIGGPLDPCDELSALWYPPGAFYRPHVDLGVTPDASGLHRRRASVVIFLNGGPADGARPFTGGRLRLYGLLDDERTADVGLDLDPERGTLVAFPSGLWHEVTPVETGDRFTIVTWLLSPE
jgi:Rps23 Pro-64 3,4-dihydroxylase Tpa1-like proline 4-hydroxylase